MTGVSKSSEGYQDVYDFACINPSQAGTLPVRVPNRGADCKLGTQGGTDVARSARHACAGRRPIRYSLTLATDYTNDQSEVRPDTLVAGDAERCRARSRCGAITTSFPKYGVRFDQRFVPSNRYVSYATYDDPSERPQVRSDDLAQAERRLGEVGLEDQRRRALGSDPVVPQVQRPVRDRRGPVADQRADGGRPPGIPVAHG